MSAELGDTFSPIDILVNNAGISSHIDSASMALPAWQKVLDVNMTGVFLCCQVFAPAMMARGWGRIISISSMSGLIVNKNVAQAPYYASKAGVIMLTKALAAEWGAYNITVNAIAPGYMRTPLNNEFLADPARAAEWTSGVPLARSACRVTSPGRSSSWLPRRRRMLPATRCVVDGGFTVW